MCVFFFTSPSFFFLQLFLFPEVERPHVNFHPYSEYISRRERYLKIIRFFYSLKLIVSRIREKGNFGMNLHPLGKVYILIFGMFSIREEAGFAISDGLPFLFPSNMAPSLFTLKIIFYIRFALKNWAVIALIAFTLFILLFFFVFV